MIDIYKKNEAKLIISSEDQGILREIWEHFSFYADNYRFMPSYRNKMWDGKIRIFDLRTQELPFGLLIKLSNFAKKRQYKLNIKEEVLKDYTITVEDQIFKTFAGECDLKVSGRSISPRDYQLDAFSHAVNNRRSILLSPTGSGKSLIIYLLIRYFLKSLDLDGSILIVVPTTSLVAQMTKDFEEYSSGETKVHQIYSGKEKFKIESRIVITTWQSAYKLPKSWFDKFNMVIGDEAHTFKAKSLIKIMDSLENASFRIGTTGTLPSENDVASRMTLEGCFGPVYKVTTTKNLIDSNTLAPLEINCLILQYSDEECKLVKKMDYFQEIDFLVAHIKRNNFIQNLVLKQTGNTLLLYNLVEKHGKVLYETLLDKCSGTNRKVFFVHGGIATDEREEIRRIAEKENSSIVLHFGNLKVNLGYDDKVILTNGSFKYAKNITEDDDVCEKWIKVNCR